MDSTNKARARRCVVVGLPIVLSATIAWLLLRSPVEISLAFGRRCIPISFVARRSNTPVCSTPRALLLGRIDALDAQVIPTGLLSDNEAATPQRNVAAKPARAEPPPEDEMHPHPIDAQRLAINRENNFNASMMGAMNVGDYLGLRALIEEYSMDYPEDEYRLQAGYGLIADCLEALTSERQEAARKYWQENRGSLARRFIRRHCLERNVVDG